MTREGCQVLTLVLLLITAGTASCVLAQEAAEAADESLTYDDYTVKAYSLSLYGGYFSGGTFFELPPIADDRTFVEEGTNRVMGYNGEWLPLDPAVYDAPRKRIESGGGFGGTLGIYLSDVFHMDLSLTMSKSKATTTMLYRNPNDPENPYREKVDEDDSFNSYTGGVNLIYDIRNASFAGMFPYVGFGLGGVINSFTVLDDKTALFFEGVGGLRLHLAGDFSLQAQVNLRTFSFLTEELNYSQQVTFANFFVGVSYFIDVVPADVRAARDLE